MPIDFAPTDEERLLVEAAARLARDRLRPAMRRAEATLAPDPDAAAAFAALGASGDAAGLDFAARVLVLEELGWGDAAQTLALDGRGLAAVAWTEMADAGDPLPPAGRVIVVHDDPDPRLAVDPETGPRGEIAFVPVGHADAALVLKDGCAYLVAPPGFTLEPCRGGALDAAGGARLRFGAGAPGAGLVRTLAPAPGAYRRAVARLWTYVGALLVGVARASLEYVQRYTQERTAFGKPIAHHQGVAFLIADCAIAVEAARWAVRRAAVDPRPAVAGAAWHEAIDAALFVTNQGVQLLGGHGYVKDHPVEKWMREARTLSLLLGGREAPEATDPDWGDATPGELSP